MDKITNYINMAERALAFAVEIITKNLHNLHYQQNSHEAAVQ